MKKCSKCQKNKDSLQFSKSQFIRSGGICRECSTKLTRIYRQNNKDKIDEYNKIYGKKYYKDNKDKILQNKKGYYQKNKDEILEDRKEYYFDNKNQKVQYNKIYYQENKDEILEKVKIYAKEHKEEIKIYHNQYYKDKRENNLNFKLKTNISANINFYLKSNNLSKNKKSTLKYLQYSIEELKIYIESLFDPWMNWNNYGKYNSKIYNDNDSLTWTWQIDHIIPHSKFNYTSMEDEEFKKCWALSNLRPLNSKQNFLDGVKRTRH